jgi:hypothetical protein
MDTPSALTQIPLDLLKPLRIDAEAAAPHLSSVISTGSLPASAYSPLSSQQMSRMAEDFQHWFINLFDTHDPAVEPDRHKIFLRSQRKYNDLPLSLILGNLDIVLQVGREVTSLSPYRELAYRTFIKRLSCELVEQQIRMEQRLELFSDLLLHD